MTTPPATLPPMLWRPEWTDTPPDFIAHPCGIVTLEDFALAVLRREVRRMNLDADALASTMGVVQ